MRILRLLRGESEWPQKLCYDGEALESRNEHKPAGSAVEMAAAMGVDC
jgi:hypothetical protein